MRLKSEDNFAKVISRHFSFFCQLESLQIEKENLTPPHHIHTVRSCSVSLMAPVGGPTGTRVPLYLPALLCAAAKRLDLVYQHLKYMDCLVWEMEHRDTVVSAEITKEFRVFCGRLNAMLISLALTWHEECRKYYQTSTCIFDFIVSALKTCSNVEKENNSCGSWSLTRRNTCRFIIYCT